MKRVVLALGLAAVPLGASGAQNLAARVEFTPAEVDSAPHPAVLQARTA